MMEDNYKISQSREYYKALQTEENYKVTQTMKYYKSVLGEAGDATAPVLQTAIIPEDGLSLFLNYNEALDTSFTDTGCFSLAGTSSLIDSVTVSGSTVTLTLDKSVYQGETVTISYTAGVNAIQDLSGNKAANLVDSAVTNNSTQVAFCDEYNAVYNKFTTKPSEAVATAQNTMVAALVDGGVWSKMDRFFVFAGHTNDNGESLLDWIDPTRNAVAVNSPTFTPYEGFLTNGTTQYIDTVYDMVNDPVNYANDSSHWSLYRRNYSVGNGRDFGAWNLYLITQYTPTESRIQANGSMQSIITNNNFIGLWVLNRDSSTTIQVDKNGSTMLDTSNTFSSVTNMDIYIGCRNFGGPNSFRNGQYSEFSVGGKLTPGERAILKNAFEAYMDSNGKGVIN